MNFRALILLVSLVSVASADENLNCLSDDVRNAHQLYTHLQQEAYAALDRRLETYEALKTPEDIREYQTRSREFFTRRLGGFPEKTPLNAQTVRTISADGYRIENVIFESRPRHHITANLYLPDRQGPFPGVVVSSGHSRTAKTADYNQRFGIMMARHGMAALCFDPIGQGERSQILNDQGQNRFAGTTKEHFLMGVGSILVGRNTASYRVWDAMRSIDYLVSRPEIEPQKIGMTGCSGGGTLTSYTMALDDRVTCAAPSCYLTTFRRLIETIGPQDAEQNIFGQLAFGLDQPDYVLLRAPKPTLISATTQDFFDIGGSWQNFRQVKRMYGRLGLPEQVDLVEIEGKHGVTPQNLATIAHWMKRWLLKRDEPVAAVELATRPAEELICTEKGQVLLLPDELSVFDLNAAYEAELVQARRALSGSLSAEQLRERIREKIGTESVGQLPAPTSELVGTVSRDGYLIEKHLLNTGRAVPLPTLVFRPRIAEVDICLYLHDEGKSADAAVGGEIERLTKSGSVVVSVDLSGQGETASGRRDEQLGDWKTYYLAYLLERSLVGIRVEDTLATARFAAGLAGEEHRPVTLIGFGQSGTVALHTAALQPELFARVTLRDTPHDWASVVGRSNPGGFLDHTVHGALELYDLPDLVRLAGNGKVEYLSGYIGFEVPD